MKKFIIGFLLATILINSVALSFFFVIHTHFNYIQRRDSEIRDIEREMLFDLQSFSLLIQPFEEQAREYNEKALSDLCAAILAESGDNPLAISNDALIKMVEPYGVIDAYLLDKSGTIIRSSFTKDIGLNLLELGHATFSTFVRGVYGTGNISTQRLSLSNMSGKKMIYSYYSPAGSDWLIETSVRFEDFIRTRYSDELYDHLFHAFFDQLSLTHNQLKNFDIIYQTSVSSRSFLSGEEVRVGPEILEVLNKGESYIFRNGTVRSIYMKRRMEKKEFDFVQFPILYLEYDLSAHFVFLLKFYVISGIGILLFLVMLSIIAYRLVEAKLVRRIEELADVLQSSVDEDYSRRVAYSSRIPELMMLADSANLLIEKVRDRELKLRLTLQERETLLEEINHRVKNNLNVVVSLLNLQDNQITTIGEAKKALLKTKNRIYSMALTHEKLYQSEDFTNVKMKTYIESLENNIKTSFEKSANIRTETAVQEIFLPISYAIPCGIIINELLMNAYTHAFPGDNRGSIVIRLENDGISGYILTIEDDGIGMPDDFSLHSIDTLGLILVQTLSEQLDGSLEVLSKSGTQCIVHFSLARN